MTVADATLPGKAELFAALEATWPAATLTRQGPLTLRDGQGGGSRVSAATLDGDPDAAIVDAAEAAMRDRGDAPLFMVRDGEAALDAALAARGYRVKDPVVAWVVPLNAVTVQRPPPATTFESWPPLAIQAEIWAEGGIGASRLKVMERAAGPKTSLLGRLSDQPAGSAFVAVHDGLAMLHALEVLPRFRRGGLGRHLLVAAGFWARAQGAAHLSLVVTRANAGANALYASLGMTRVTEYHYRIGEEAPR